MSESIAAINNLTTFRIDCERKNNKSSFFKKLVSFFNCTTSPKSFHCQRNFDNGKISPSLVANMNNRNVISDNASPTLPSCTTSGSEKHFYHALTKNEGSISTYFNISGEGEENRSVLVNKFRQAYKKLYKKCNTIFELNRKMSDLGFSIKPSQKEVIVTIRLYQYEKVNCIITPYDKEIRADRRFSAAVRNEICKKYFQKSSSDEIVCALREKFHNYEINFVHGNHQASEPVCDFTFSKKIPS